MDVGFNLVTDPTNLLNGLSQAAKQMEGLSNETKGYEKTATEAFKGVAFGVGNIGDEIASGTKSTGKLTEEVNKLGKTKNAVQQLKAEIKFYTAEAYKAGEGTKAFKENLEKAGKLKDQLGDLNAQVQALNGNLGENFARAAGNSIGLVAKGFEGITALQTLAGANNKAFEETLLRLQSLNALASLSQEFAGLGDKITEIKLGFAGFISNATAGLKRLWLLALENPFTAFAVVLGTIVAVFILLKDKAGAFFDTNVERLEKSIEGTKEYLDVLKQEADFFVKRAEAQGRNAYAVELQQLSDIRQAIKGKIADLNQLQAINKKLTDDQIELGKDLEKQLTEVSDRLTLLALNRQKKQLEFLDQTISAEKDLRISQIADEETREKAQAAKRRDDAYARMKKEIEFLFTAEETEKVLKEQAVLLNGAYQREITDIEKKFADKRLAQRKELQNAFNELIKRTAAAEEEGLSGEAKISKERENALAELQIFRTSLESKAKETNKNFKFSEEQLKQFQILEQSIYRDETAKLLQLQIERESAGLKLTQASTNEKVKILDLEIEAKEAAVRGTKKPSGISQEDFEIEKEKKLLLIKRAAAIQSVAIKQKQVDEEIAILVQEAQAEIAILKAKGDAESLDRASKIEGAIGDIEARGKAQKDVIIANTQAVVTEIDEQLSTLEKNQKKFSLAKVLGVSDNDIRDFETALADIGNAYTAFLQIRINEIDREISENQKAIDAREKNLQTLRGQLDHEKELRAEGKANNLDLLNQQIAAEQAAKDEALAQDMKLKEEKKKLAKEQLITDSIVQGSNLLVASSQIFATMARDPITTALAALTVAAMIAAFALQKKAAFDAVNNNNFAKGVINLQGPGTETSDSISANLSKGESVMTAKETREHLSLFKGIRMNDDNLIHEGVLNLIRDKGIMLTPDVPASFIKRRNDLRQAESKQYFISDNKPVTAELLAMNKKFDALLKQNRNKTYTDAKGNTIIQTGSHTQIIRHV